MQLDRDNQAEASGRASATRSRWLRNVSTGPRAPLDRCALVRQRSHLARRSEQRFARQRQPSREVREQRQNSLQRVGSFQLRESAAGGEPLHPRAAARAGAGAGAGRGAGAGARRGGVPAAAGPGVAGRHRAADGSGWYRHLAVLKGRAGGGGSAAFGSGGGGMGSGASTLHLRWGRLLCFQFRHEQPFRIGDRDAHNLFCFVNPTGCPEAFSSSALANSCKRVCRAVARWSGSVLRAPLPRTQITTSSSEDEKEEQRPQEGEEAAWLSTRSVFDRHVSW